MSEENVDETGRQVGDSTDERLDGRAESVEPARSGPAYDHRTTVIARTVVRATVPIILVTALALLFQGHNRPGGGFIGGVLAVTAVVLVYVIFGLEFLQSDLLGLDSGTESHRPTEYYRWLFAVGLALAAGSGLVPILYGLPFLTQGVAFLHHLPVYGELEVASALAFDLGVFAVVVGGLLTVVAEVGEQ